ncbi:hypothetical protein [Streptomyces marincola]|uniref:hypothetical protein n=1 Tax=Streptomyces marincola TaxID=2878388 RepID=UPI001CF1F065|nr:hypothetical protein [Streptomyces marincola]UCM88523.1 hypothetical protein LC193_11485 [Streptomyces marincola]
MPSASPTVKRSRARRAGESAYGALLLARVIAVWLLVLLLVGAGALAAWDSARHSVLTDGRERGTMLLADCDRTACEGPFDATGRTVVLPQPVARQEGERLAVALVPDGEGEVVRTGWAGALYGCLPLFGALLLASVVIGGALRMARTALSVAAAALALLAATFALWI